MLWCLQVLLECIEQEYAALREAASLKLRLRTADAGTAVQADNSSDKQVQIAEMTNAEEQA
jgi:hypothetical protein